MESWSLDSLKEFQLDRLHDLLADTVNTNEFYRNYFSGVDISKIKTVNDFSISVPAISRYQYQANFDQLLSYSSGVKLSKAGTSGTTGMALQFFHAKSDNQREWAAICHQWKRVGYDPARSRRAEFRGLTAHNELVQKFPDSNMIRCSILAINAGSLKYFADEIQSNGIDFYHGYPSALYLLAREINNSVGQFPQPKGILLASEQVYQWQLDEIERAFPDVAIMAHYGCAERVVLGGWCEYERVYHVLPQYSLVEIDEQTKEIIGTNLFNSINPFIRYRMTDVVTSMDTTPCPRCGRPYTPRFQLSGRSEDFLYSPQNGWIPPAIVTYPLKDLRAIGDIRFLQDEAADITVEYTVRSGFKQGVNDEILMIGNGMREILGAELRLRFQEVQHIERNATGKFKWIVSRYAKDEKTSNAETRERHTSC